MGAADLDGGAEPEGREPDDSEREHVLRAQMPVGDEGHEVEPVKAGGDD